MAFPPRCLTNSCVSTVASSGISGRAVGVRSAQTKKAPLAARASEIHRPSPDDEPVTMAIRDALEQKVKSQCEKDAQKKCDKEKAQLQQQNTPSPVEKPDDLSQELAKIGRNQLCPGYNGRTFENSDGSRNKWIIQCGVMLNRGAWDDKLHQCTHHSIIDALKDYQELKGRYKNFWFNAANWCNHVVDLRLPLLRGPSYDHHFIERIE